MQIEIHKNVNSISLSDFFDFYWFFYGFSDQHDYIFADSTEIDYFRLP